MIWVLWWHRVVPYRSYVKGWKTVSYTHLRAHETDPARQRALMREFEKYVLDDEAHMIWVLWWHRIVPYRSYVRGWKISPTHFINQDLATIWLDK